MALFFRSEVKQWIYGLLFISIILLILLWLKSKATDDFNLALSAAISRPNILTLETSEDNTKQHQTSISGTERPLVVQEICRTFKVTNISSNWQLRGKFLIDRSLYYCNIPKCGSTFMDLFLLKIFQCNGLCDEIFITSNELRNKTLHMIGSSYSFMFVRDPYARLFSAYENKLFLPNEHWAIIGKDVIEKVRPHASFVSKELGHDVTFLDLVKYVLKLYERGIRLNNHFVPMHMHCGPCEIRYNFIGKLETMSNDLVDLVEDWKTKGIVSKNMSSAKEIEANILYERSFGPYKHMFTILKKYGKILSRYKAFQRTWSSYQIRGLILKKYNMPFAENEVAKINHIRFGDEIKKALDASMGHVDELKAQRKEALIQAYKTVPMNLMMKLREFMKPDCLLFGYDVMPEFLFNRTSLPSSDGFDYFKGL
ncbi:uncharacterized protein LOC123560790 [Mercenaria mercenaria]|uniref:uncharacterized protein LOC123560790 n=1 Tax=Mercenaria mercenaria TaxID=6596 RepID=UPI00234FB0CD|nr:uncharacterized protein LOC123560790 [Mercenaria mercenaria]